MHNHFSPDELARLLGLVGNVARDHDCSVDEAITIMATCVPPRVEGRPRRACTTGEYADRLRRLRMRRNEFLGVDVLRDPAWDMLLSLMAAHDDNRETCVKTLCFGAGVPPTTALRHIDRLERHGLVHRGPHPSDSRRTIVSLAPERVGDLERLINMFRNVQ